MPVPKEETAVHSKFFMWGAGLLPMGGLIASRATDSWAFVFSRPARAAAGIDGTNTKQDGMIMHGLHSNRRHFRSARCGILVGVMALLVAGVAAAQVKPIGTTGSYPDIQLDKQGNLHLVYARSGKTYYRVLPRGTAAFLPEEYTGAGASNDHRYQPDVAVDSKGVVHVLGNTTYNTRTATGWGTAIRPGVGRDHHMAVASNDDVWVVYRGNQLTARQKKAGASQFGAAVNIFSGGGTDHVYPDICAGTDGTVHVVFRMQYPTNYDCAYLRYDGQKWGTVEWACLNGRSKVEEGPHVALDRNNVPWAAIPEGSLRINHRTGGTWNHTIVSLGSAPTRSEPTIGVDPAGNKFVGLWGGAYWVYRASTNKWTSGKLPSTNTDPIGFVDVVADTTANGSGAFMVYEQGKSVNKDVGAGAVDLVAVKVLPDGTVVPPGSTTSPTFAVDLTAISAQSGGVLNFTLTAGAAQARKSYIVLGGLSGTSPGLYLPGAAHLPLNIDHFTLAIYVTMGTPRFQRFAGILDSTGRGRAHLQIDPGMLTALVGFKMYFAYMTVPNLSFASTPVDIRVEP